MGCSLDVSVEHFGSIVLSREEPRIQDQARNKRYHALAKHPISLAD